MTLMHDIQLIIPEIFMALMAMGLLMVGVFQKDAKTSCGSVTWLSVNALLITAFLTYVLMGFQGTAFNNLFINDGFASFTKIIILIGTAIGIVMTMVDFEGARDWRFEIPVLFVLAALGMMVMVSANNFMTLYMGLELQSLALYVLASIKRDTLKSTEAGLKYFVLGSLASGFILYGMSLFYGYTGSLSFDVLNGLVGDLSMGAVLGLVFLLAGIAFKLSAVPFHMWTPDVYEGAPTALVAFFAAIPKFAMMMLLVRLLTGPLLVFLFDWQQILMFVSVSSMILGAFAALTQVNIKRLFAYSSIGHVGYALMIFAAGQIDVASISALIFYMVIYSIMSIGAFGVVILLRHQDLSIEKISDLAGLSKDRPVIALFMAIFMFSMAGIPPLAGFFSKFYVFKSVIDAGFIVLAIVGVLSSVVAAFYYLRVIKVMYFDEGTEGHEISKSPALRFILLLCAVSLVVLIFNPSSLMTVITNYAVLGLM